MKTYRVAQVHREVESWTVIQSIDGEADEPVGHYLDRASAQFAWARLVAAEAHHEWAVSTDSNYEIVGDGDAFRVKITRLGALVQEADGFSSRADAASWVAEDQRLATMDERIARKDPPALRVVKP
jgi:hypothetical protein